MPNLHGNNDEPKSPSAPTTQQQESVSHENYKPISQIEIPPSGQIIEQQIPGPQKYHEPTFRDEILPSSAIITQQPLPSPPNYHESNIQNVTPSAPSAPTFILEPLPVSPKYYEPTLKNEAPPSAPIITQQPLPDSSKYYETTVKTEALPAPIITQQPVPGLPKYCEPTPRGVGWIQLPQMIPLNVPPGLEYLTTVSNLLVKQKVELLEAFVGFETNNKYTILNDAGEKVYYAIEDNDCCNRNCCGPSRSFDLNILNHEKHEIIHLQRDCACDSCLFPCCLQVLRVNSPPGHSIGSVEQTWSFCQPQFDVKNESGECVLKIEGPACSFNCCSEVEFKVLSKDRSAVVGRISKRWSGLVRELFTDADTFGISFPQDLDVRVKAVLLGALFLIDFMYFEETTQDKPEDDIFLGLCACLRCAHGGECCNDDDRNGCCTGCGDDCCACDCDGCCSGDGGDCCIGGDDDCCTGGDGGDCCGDCDCND